MNRNIIFLSFNYFNIFLNCLIISQNYIKYTKGIFILMGGAGRRDGFA